MTNGIRSKVKNKKGEAMKIKKLVSFLFFIGIILVLLLNFVSAGFGSSYLPYIDGKLTLVTSPEIDNSYYIYPQNTQSTTAYIKINILVGEGILKNSLESQYAIPANTLSDGYPIKLNLNIPKSINGTAYKFTYSVLTGSDNSNGTIYFSPVGFEKTIYISNGNPDWNKIVELGNQTQVDEEPIIPPVIHSVPSSGGSSSGGVSSFTPKKVNATPENIVNPSISNTNISQEKNKTILFDILVKILKKEIISGENLTSTISLINFGVPGKVDANVHYIIKDSAGNVYVESRETIPVETQLDFIKGFDVSGLKEGGYTLAADLTYIGQTEPATSEDTFTILKKSNNNLILIIALGVLVILVLLILFVFFEIFFFKSYLANKEKKKEK